MRLSSFGTAAAVCTCCVPGHGGGERRHVLGLVVLAAGLLGDTMDRLALLAFKVKPTTSTRMSRPRRHGLGSRQNIAAALLDAVGDDDDAIGFLSSAAKARIACSSAAAIGVSPWA